MLGDSRGVRLVRTWPEVGRLLVRSTAAAKRAERASTRGDVEAARRAFVDASYVLDEVDRLRVGDDGSGMPGDDATLDEAWQTALTNHQRAATAMLQARTTPPTTKLGEGFS